MNKLNERQQRFCQEYLIDFNATRAYKVAYTNVKNDKVACVNGSRLLGNANIQAYLTVLKQERAERIQITQDDVLRDLITVKTKCMQEVKVVKWDYSEKKLVETGEYQFDSKGANQALKLIGDHLGMFQQNVNLTGNVKVNQYENLTEDQLRKLADEK